MGINLAAWNLDGDPRQAEAIRKMNEANRAKPWGEPYKGYTGPSKTEFMEADGDPAKTAALHVAGERARAARRSR